MKKSHVPIPVIMDDGTQRVFSEFRIQYTNARGTTNHWNEDVVHSLLKVQMADTNRTDDTIVISNNISLRCAAYSLVMEYRVDAMKMRGWI